MSQTDYDWAQATFDLFGCVERDIGSLVKAAKLNPYENDLEDADFSGVDLTGQNLSGWNLGNAVFDGANLAGADLRNAKVNFFNLIKGKQWEKAVLGDGELAEAQRAEKLSRKIRSLQHIRRSSVLRLLDEAGIELIGDLVQLKPGELLSIVGFGRQSLKRIRYALALEGLDLNTKLQGWPVVRMQRILSARHFPSNYFENFSNDKGRLKW